MNNSEAVGHKFPPVALLASMALAAVIAGGIVMVAAMPQEPPLELIVGLLGLAGLLLAVSVELLAGIKGFNWSVFRKVTLWALVAYSVSGGMIEFTFWHNSVSGRPLLLLSLLLLGFVLSVPLIIGFNVARYASE